MTDVIVENIGKRTKDIKLRNIYNYGHFSFKEHSEEYGFDYRLAVMKKDAVARVINLKNPKVAENLIYYCLEHIGPDFSAWVNENVKRNFYLNEEAVKVIFQLLDFIKTGEFKPGVHALPYILTESNYNRFDIPSYRKIFDYSSTGLPVNTIEVLRKSIASSERGIFVLLDIMNLIFGSVKGTVKVTPPSITTFKW